MEYSLKNYLHPVRNFVSNGVHVAVIVALLAFAFGAVWLPLAYVEVNRPLPGNFSVAAEGKIVVVPDVAEFTFGVITEGGTNLATLQKENTEKANGAIAFVKTQGVAEKDVKTQSYAIEPRYKYFSCPREGGACPPPQISGYSVSQSVAIKVRDFSKIGEILSGIVAKGVNGVSALSFTVDDPVGLEAKARSEAIAKAKEKARTLAEAGGFRLGKLVSIEEGGAQPRPVYRQALGKTLGQGESAPPPAIEPGSQEIKVTITLTYEIK